MTARGATPLEAVTYAPDAAAAWRAGEASRLAAVGAARAGNGLLLTRGTWVWETRNRREYVLSGTLEFANTTQRQELFVSECDASVRVLGNAPIGDVEATSKVTPLHDANDDYAKDALERKDGYWVAYILKAQGTTQIRVTVQIAAGMGVSLTDVLDACVVRVRYVSYGPNGRRECAQHVVLPLRAVPLASPAASASASLVAVKTHLLCHLDEPVAALAAYAKPHVTSPDDVVTIGESPLALMQGRFRHPETVRPGMVARLACRLFQPTSSLATACGMQSLVDAVGARRVALATVGGAALRLATVRGGFYRLAGRQARLVDDVTGTLAPYDQFICLGPSDVESFVEAAKAALGCEVAVVDVNDLSRQKGSIHVLASTDGVDEDWLSDRMLDNPAGNGAEQTPVVVVRRRDD